MVTQEFLAKVDMARLKKAAQGLAVGAMQVLIEGRDDGAVWGLVRNGEDKVYSVQVVHGSSSCSCPDFAYRHTICKHALALALHSIEHPTEGERKEERKPDLRLARVRSDDEIRRDTASWRRDAEEVYGVAV